MDWGALAAAAFASEQREHFRGAAIGATRELLARQIDELARRVGRAHASCAHAAALGIPNRLAPLVGVLLFAPSRDDRVRAAQLIGLALKREAA
jgi:hypothetical protein